MVQVAHLRSRYIHDLFDRNPSLVRVRWPGREALPRSVDRKCDISERCQEHRLVRITVPTVPVTDNNRRIGTACQRTRQITVDTDVSTGVYCIRRAWVSP